MDGWIASTEEGLGVGDLLMLQTKTKENVNTNYGGPPADLLINQGVRDNVSGHTTRAPPSRVRTDNQRFQRYVIATRL